MARIRTANYVAHITHVLTLPYQRVHTLMCLIPYTTNFLVSRIHGYPPVPLLPLVHARRTNFVVA